MQTARAEREAAVRQAAEARVAELEAALRLSRAGHRRRSHWSGKTFNCKVANLRARAVGAFLADDGNKLHWKCPGEDGDFEGASTCAAEHCDGESRHLRMSDGQDRSIGIVVEQWVSEEQMRKGKPANDGSRPDNRRYRVEVMNRAVHIEVLQDFCAVPESLT